MFIVLLEYVKPLADIDAVLEEHRKYLDALYSTGGPLLASGPQNPRRGGFFIIGADRDAVNRLIEADPFHRAGVAEYHIYECEPTKATTEFKAALDGCVQNSRNTGC